MTTTPLTGIVRDHSAEALALAAIVAQAEAVQWSPSITPKPRDDTAERSRGTHSDPTLATVIDDRRLTVRANVEASRRALADSIAAMRKCRLSLEAALDNWAGN